jgi:hypothetical protein
MTPTEAARHTARAAALMEQGDIAGARLLLARASAAGGARAAFLLAETYDPARLAALNVVGIKADAAKARALYQQALAGGMQEAAARLAGLR